MNKDYEEILEFGQSCESSERHIALSNKRNKQGEFQLYPDNPAPGSSRIDT